MKILILTQAAPRDTLIDERLAKLLRKAGHDAWVTGFVGAGRKEICKKKPDCVVLPEIRCEYSSDFVEVLNKMNVIVVVRRCEPGLSWDTFNKATKEFREVTLGDRNCKLDLELVWANEFTEILNTPNVYPVGAFAFDNYFPKPNKIPHDKKTVLFAACWDYADRLPQYTIPEAPIDSPLQFDAYDRAVKGRTAWIKEILRLCDKHKDWHFILKTHPAELSFIYERHFGDKVEVIWDKAMKDVLPRADLLVHAGSTTAIEAHFCGIPALQFCNYIIDHPLLDVSPTVESVDLDAVELGKSNASITAITKLEKTFFGRMDGKTCERSANLIAQLKPRTTNIPRKWPELQRSYETPGILKHPKWGVGPQDISQCVGCHNLYYLPPGVRLCKCPWCSLMQIR